MILNLFGTLLFPKLLTMQNVTVKQALVAKKNRNCTCTDCPIYLSNISISLHKTILNRCYGRDRECPSCPSRTVYVMK